MADTFVDHMNAGYEDMTKIVFRVPTIEQAEERIRRLTGRRQEIIEHSGEDGFNMAWNHAVNELEQAKKSHYPFNHGNTKTYEKLPVPSEKEKCIKRFNQLKNNREELISTYGLLIYNQVLEEAEKELEEWD